MAKIKISTTGIKRSLRSYGPLQAIIEYIWNGFDANASCVELKFYKSPLGSITGITIKDNGHGINKSDLKYKFIPFLESEKQIDPNRKRVTSAVHGKNGIGRLTFYHFASNAEWETVYLRDGNKYKYSIDINNDSLDEYFDSEETNTDEPIGTTVRFSGIQNKHITVETVTNFIAREFGWYLELNKERKYSIKIDDNDLDYTWFIGDRDSVTVKYKETNRCFDIRYIRWNDKLNSEFSRYYFIDSQGEEKLSNTTSLNNKGDAFYHSVFVKSDFFDDINFVADDNSDVEQLTIFGGKRIELKFILSEINKLLRRKRKPFLKLYTDKLITDFQKTDAFPKYNLNNAWERTRKKELEKLVGELYQVEPKIFSNMNIEQKKTFVRFLDLIMDSGESERMFDILGEIVDLDSTEREELANLFRTSKLSSIIRTIKLIQDRFKAINELKRLLFNKEITANERDHIQKFIEKHYWLFGEQYHLISAAEPRFEEVLRRYTYLLYGDTEKRFIDHPDKNKEMDIFMIRQDKRRDTINNVVVELKHPNVTLGKKQLDQVDTYLNVILGQDEFNAQNMFWEFILIGNKLDESGHIRRQYENARSYGEKYLVFNNPRYKIYVKTWSDIFTEFEIRHTYLTEKLELERDGLMENLSSADDIIKNLDMNSAIQPGQIIVPN